MDEATFSRSTSPLSAERQFGGRIGFYRCDLGLTEHRRSPLVRTGPRKVTETTGTGVPIVLLSKLDPDVRSALRPRSPPDRRSAPFPWFLGRGRPRPHTRPANRSCRTSSAWQSPCPDSLRNTSAAAQQPHPKPPPGGRRSLPRLPGPRSDN